MFRRHVLVRARTLPRYQAVGASSWTALPVTVNVAKGRARVLRCRLRACQTQQHMHSVISVTDCAFRQTTQSGTYYFKVVRFDYAAGNHRRAVFGGRPLAADADLGCESAFELDANYSVL